MKHGNDKYRFGEIAINSAKCWNDKLCFNKIQVFDHNKLNFKKPKGNKYVAEWNVN